MATMTEKERREAERRRRIRAVSRAMERKLGMSGDRFPEPDFSPWSEGDIDNAVDFIMNSRLGEED